MWLNFPTNSQRTLKVPAGHIVIKLMGTLWKNSKGSFTKYPLGTLWTLCERTKGVCSKSTHWVLCWVLFESAHHLPAGYEPGELMGTFWKQSILTCWVFCWVNWWVLFKCAHYLPAGFGLGKWVGTFESAHHLPAGYEPGKLFQNPQLNHNVPTGYITLCPQCIPVHLFDCHDIFDKSPLSLFNNPIPLTFSINDTCLIKHLLP